jgi:hypothetical protein
MFAEDVIIRTSGSDPEELESRIILAQKNNMTG